MSEMMTRHLTIRGRVQGVGYRNYFEYKARQLGISGWVRNRSDGSVEAVVHGAAAAVDAIIECARRGPRAAQVNSVEVREESGDYALFETRPTVWVGMGSDTIIHLPRPPHALRHRAPLAQRLNLLGEPLAAQRPALVCAIADQLQIILRHRRPE